MWKTTVGLTLCQQVKEKMGLQGFSLTTTKYWNKHKKVESAKLQLGLSVYERDPIYICLVCVCVCVVSEGPSPLAVCELPLPGRSLCAVVGLRSVDRRGGEHVRHVHRCHTLLIFSPRQPSRPVRHAEINLIYNSSSCTLSPTDRSLSNSIWH